LSAFPGLRLRKTTPRPISRISRKAQGGSFARRGLGGRHGSASRRLAVSAENAIPKSGGDAEVARAPAVVVDQVPPLGSIFGTHAVRQLHAGAQAMPDTASRIFDIIQVDEAANRGGLDVLTDRYEWPRRDLKIIQPSHVDGSET